MRDKKVNKRASNGYYIRFININDERKFKNKLKTKTFRLHRDFTSSVKYKYKYKKRIKKK